MVAGAIHKLRVRSFDQTRRIRTRLSRHQSHPPGRQRRLSSRTQRSGADLLWLTEAEANRLAALRRRGESYSDAVIRLAKHAQD